MSAPTLILASRSPRRIELLRDAGYAFAIDPADINEEAIPSGLSPREIAIYLAVSKARVVARRHAGAIVIGADTIVAVGSRLFGKAETPDEARTMLDTLAGTRQSVITGIALVRVAAAPFEYTDAAESVVGMRKISPQEINAYVASDAWRGKAGAYGIQDEHPERDPFVQIIGGDFDNIVGLPMRPLTAMLQDAGVRPANRIPDA